MNNIYSQYMNSVPIFNTLSIRRLAMYLILEVKKKKIARAEAIINREYSIFLIGEFLS